MTGPFLGIIGYANLEFLVSPWLGDLVEHEGCCARFHQLGAENHVVAAVGGQGADIFAGVGVHGQAVDGALFVLGAFAVALVHRTEGLCAFRTDDGSAVGASGALDGHGFVGGDRSRNHDEIEVPGHGHVERARGGDGGCEGHDEAVGYAGVVVVHVEGVDARNGEHDLVADGEGARACRDVDGGRGRGGGDGCLHLGGSHVTDGELLDVRDGAELVDEGPGTAEVAAEARFGECARHGLLALGGQVAPYVPVHEAVEGAVHEGLEERTGLLEGGEVAADEDVADGQDVFADDVLDGLLGEILADLAHGDVLAEGGNLLFDCLHVVHHAGVLDLHRNLAVLDRGCGRDVEVCEATVGSDAHGHVGDFGLAEVGGLVVDDVAVVLALHFSGNGAVGTCVEVSAVGDCAEGEGNHLLVLNGGICHDVVLWPRGGGT